MPHRQDMNTIKVLLIVLLGAFAMGNAKFSIIQLVPSIAADLQAHEDLIWDAVSAYFWGALFGSPIIAMLCRNWHKQTLLTMLSLWCFVGNVLSSFAWSGEALYALRFLSGLPHGAFLAIAVLFVAENVPSEKRGWYIGWALSGIGFAMVLAVPFNTWIGLSYGWQVPFRFVALLDILIVLFMHDLLPKEDKGKMQLGWNEQWLSLSQAHIGVYMLIGLLIISAMTCIWSFGLPLLQQQSNMPAQLNTALVVILALGFLVGQIGGGYLADKNVHRYIGINALWSIGILLVLWWCLRDYRLALAAMLGIGMMATINVLVQVRLLDTPPATLYLMLALYNSAVQLGNFIGSWFGHFFAYSAFNSMWLLAIALVLSLCACLLWRLSVRLDAVYLAGQKQPVSASCG